MKKFTHIGQFYQVRKYVDMVNADPECPEKYKIRKPITYQGTVKLHGTNSGVRVDKETITCQSRNRIIDPTNDNLQFAAWMGNSERQSVVRTIVASLREEWGIRDEDPVTLFGEWCGPGIQKGVAINQLPERQWVLFSACVSMKEDRDYIGIEAAVSTAYKKVGICSIFHGPVQYITVDWTDKNSLLQATMELDFKVKEVESECPWAAKFGISGLGEGLVWVPTGEYRNRTELWFKTKGEKHKITKSKNKGIQLDPEVIASIDAFVEFAVTDVRLNQGVEYLNEQHLQVGMQNTSTFLRWIAKDIERECKQDLIASGLSWERVSKSVNTKALSFFKAKVEEL